MLVLKQIIKEYNVGDTTVKALRGIDMEFRKSEFVSILGPSGCGKTTLLNIIGGLDQYTSGDLIIGGRSTKDFNDRDWDAYRNHSIGFVFQSYNLIPHQTVLANVELALTLSGVGKAERRRRATEALEKVGLGDQLHKKPNQMSGGQMQRVAIARALVNDPEILLADEPTGALDSETSVQVMEILQEISKDRLIIMVTHNPELAERYSSRIIRLLDGRIVDDTDPYHGNTVEPVLKAVKKSSCCAKKERKKNGKTSMSFFTALSLSLNNLMTKKGRTFMTSFAGSIGIIGVALILSVSTGVQSYIDRVQEDTLSSYPITLEKESVDLSSMISNLMNAGDDKTATHEMDRVYANTMMYDLINSMNRIETNVNNLKDFKKAIENNEAFSEYASAVSYKYDLNLNIFTKDKNGNVIKSDSDEVVDAIWGGMATSAQLGMMSSSYQVWEEMLPGTNGELINSLLKEQYDCIYGHWPEKYDEAVVIVDSNNEINDFTLYALGLRTREELQDIMRSASKREEIDTSSLGSWSYEDICNSTFKLILSPDLYQKQADGTYKDLTETQTGLDYLYGNGDTGVTLKIVGIIRANDDAVASMMKGSLAYTSALTDYVIDNTAENAMLLEQKNSPERDIFTGLPFPRDNTAELTNTEKAQAIKDYFHSINNAKKAELYISIASTPSESYLSNAVNQYLSVMNRSDMEQLLIRVLQAQMGMEEDQVKGYITAMDDATITQYVTQILQAQEAEKYTESVKGQLASMTTDELALLFDSAVYTDEEYAALYDTYMPDDVSDSTYEKNLTKLGYVDKESPSTIYIYASTFAAKDQIADFISEYNDSVNEEDRINYTDYVALLMSSITTIINAISYVLIAFVAISLVVSSIMIGIITYISVLERTKEIGILRAIGASKRDISRVFNAETLIVGFVAGMIGIIVTLLLLIPINIILHTLTGISILSATLPVAGAVILVGISMLLTFVAGLIPSRYAAKKDPVTALRTE